MPNHVTTIIKSSNSALINLLKDFKQIIPQPEIFEEFGWGITQSGYIDEFVEYVKNKKLTIINRDVLENLAIEFGQLHNIPDEQINNEAILQAHCYFETGCKDPLEWNRKHWGTKWNSYSFELIEEGCKFDTAWTHPLPIIGKLSEMHPNEEIEVLYADEDIGYNLGHYKIKNGYTKTIFDEDKEDEKSKTWFALCIKGMQDEYAWSEKYDEYAPIHDA